jgi:hypothetical protein
MPTRPASLFKPLGVFCFLISDPLEPNMHTKSFASSSPADFTSSYRKEVISMTGFRMAGNLKSHCRLQAEFRNMFPIFPILPW